ncbi:unnamed protein product, partial [Amoebophrya sp. A25]
VVRHSSHIDPAWSTTHMMSSPRRDVLRERLVGVQSPERAKAILDQMTAEDVGRINLCGDLDQAKRSCVNVKLNYGAIASVLKDARFNTDA